MGGGGGGGGVGGKKKGGGGGGGGEAWFIIFNNILLSAYSSVGPVDRTDLALFFIKPRNYQNRSQYPPKLALWTMSSQFRILRQQRYVRCVMFRCL